MEPTHSWFNQSSCLQTCVSFTHYAHNHSPKHIFTLQICFLAFSCASGADTHWAANVLLTLCLLCRQGVGPQPWSTQEHECKCLAFLSQTHNPVEHGATNLSPEGGNIKLKSSHDRSISNYIPVTFPLNEKQTNMHTRHVLCIWTYSARASSDWSAMVVLSRSEPKWKDSALSCCFLHNCSSCRLHCIKLFRWNSRTYRCVKLILHSLKHLFVYLCGQFLGF